MHLSAASSTSGRNARRGARSAQIAAVAAALLLGVIGVFQVLLALGAPWGSAAYGGGSAGPDGVLPSGLRVASAVAAVILGVAAWVVLVRVDLVGRGPLSARLIRWATWVIVAFMALNTLSNLSSASPVERWVLGGTTIVLVLLCGYVALRAAPNHASFGRDPAP
jgi:hypothetical protein